MAGKKAERTFDEQWLRATWQQARDMQARQGHIVQFSLSPDRRQGCWIVEARLLDTADGKPVAINRRVRMQFPNADTQRLAGSLYGLLLQLDNEGDLPLLVEAGGQQ